MRMQSVMKSQQTTHQHQAVLQAFVYLAGLQLLANSSLHSALAGGCGLVAGLAYHYNFLGIKRLKVASAYLPFPSDAYNQCIPYCQACSIYLAGKCYSQTAHPCCFSIKFWSCQALHCSTCIGTFVQLERCYAKATGCKPPPVLPSHTAAHTSSAPDSLHLCPHQSLVTVCTISWYSCWYSCCQVPGDHPPEHCMVA